MAPPSTPTPLSPYEKDGQEFGLVPKYVLRKKAPMINATASMDSANSPVLITPTKSPQVVSPTATSTFDSPLPSFDSHNNNNYPSNVMKDCDDNDAVPPKIPQQVNALLQETDALLARRWRVSKLADSPAYEADKKILLQSEHYHPQKAANRIEDHWKTKLELFGPQLVEKKILLMDLTKTEKSEVGVEDGYVQLLPTRDLAGRAVLFFYYDANMYAKQSKSFRRILYYMIASALEDDETVKRGITMVAWNSGTPKPWFDPFWNAYVKFAAPYKIAKLHYCQESNDTPYTVQEKCDRETDLRLHKGSRQECLHGMVVSYGIPSHFIPLTFDGQLDRKEHLKWIDLRRRIELFPLPQQKCIVLVPGQDDVLLGKRKMSMNGNVIYHQLVASNLKAYHDANEEGKVTIRLQIWQVITDRGGRFLWQVEQSPIWEKLELQLAMHKITQAFDFLCSQYYANKNDNNKNGSKSQSSPHDDDLFFGWIFDKKRCFNLIHCKGVGTEACW